MTEKNKYRGVIVDSSGKKSLVLYKDDKSALNAIIQKFKEGTEMQLTISKRLKKRTSGQPNEETNFNGYLWGVVYKIIADEIGELDLDYIHYWAQVSVGNVRGMPDGKIVPRGTSEMNGSEFSEYCSKVRIWAGTPKNIVEGGIFIPEPNEGCYNQNTITVEQ